jgi:hypothetical protein
LFTIIEDIILKINRKLQLALPKQQHHQPGQH